MENKYSIKEVDKKTNKIVEAQYHKAFEGKIRQLDDDGKKYYSDLKNLLLSYGKTKARMSWAFESINSKSKQLAKFGVRGKTLVIYLAIDPKNIDKKYKVEDCTTRTKFVKVPTMYKIKCDLNYKYAKEMIESLIKDMKLKPSSKYVEMDYRLPYVDNDQLVAMGLAKKIVTNS